MTPSGQTLCLCMIVKNEAPVIGRCLASVRPLVDRWLVVDTGSGDGTQAIVREHLRGLPGELVERPWRDFAHNRSEALALARPLADYTLIIDADDAFEIPEGFRLPDLGADSYVIDIHDGRLRYQRTQLVSNRLPWRYRGVLHEFLACEGAGAPEPLPLVMRRNHDGARRRDPDTYRNDAALLERALHDEADPFLVSRYTFYLAQSYRDCGEPEKALGLYLARADLGFWAEEVFVALLQAGRIRDALGHPEEAVVDTYLRAADAAPARAEALHDASRYCRLKGRFEDGYALARRAEALTPPADGLFVEPWIYAYGVLDELAVNAYWTGRYQACRDACLRLLIADAELPEGYRDRVVANARFALAKSSLTEPDPINPAGETPRPARPEPSRSDWAPARPLGGTELMVEGLRARMGAALDVIHLCVNLYDPARLDGRPLVLWIHHDVDQQAVQWLRDADRVARVARFVFVSAWQRQRFVEAFGLPPELCVVLRNATEAGGLDRPRTGRTPLKVAYTSAPYRGLSVLLDAWDALRPQDAELHIWSSHRLYGPGFDDLAHEALFARAASLPNVRYRGIVPNAELRAALGDIDVLAYPSTFAETSCLAGIEAMAAGCRVICPDLGALPETTGGFARLYPYAPDPADHARAFAAVLAQEIAAPWGGDPALAGKQQDFARGTYDWTVRIAEWRAFLAGLDRGTARPDRVVEALARLRDRGFAPSGLIDAGAHDGLFSREMRRIFPEARILMVDALAEKEPVLAGLCRRIGNATHAIALLGDRDTEATPFYVVDTALRPDLVKTGASKFRENADFPMEERRVPQRRLEAVVTDRGGTFQFIKLDVQGAEVEVIRGLGDRLAEIEVILMEMSVVAYNDGAPLIDTVLADLGALGFVLYDLVEEHRYRDGSLMQVDGIFVRPDASFRPRPPFWG